jgi:hypothetical protein
MFCCNNNNKSLNFNDASLAHLPPPWNYDTHIGSNSRYNRALPRTEELVAQERLVWWLMVLEEVLRRLDGNLVVRFIVGIKTGGMECGGGDT